MTSSDFLREALVDFYQRGDNLQKVLKLINHRRKHSHEGAVLSLRLFDFFVVNYAKEHAVIIEVDGTEVDIYKSYQATQERFRKACFDPFARGGNVEDWCINGITFRSNVRQLCFMRWAIENKVIEYIQEHHKEIEDSMNKEKKSMTGPIKEGKRRTCRPAATASPEKYLVSRSRSRVIIRLEFS